MPKNTESKNPKVARTEKKRIYQNVFCVILKNQNLSNSKDRVDY